MPELVFRWRLIASATGLSAVAAYAMLVAVLPSNMVGAVVASIPEPPSESAVDLGPLIGLWYAVVSVLLLRSSVLAQGPGEACSQGRLPD